MEYGALGANVRFVVTSFRRGRVKDLFELFEQRGACENWIKELKNNLKADWLSCERFVANVYRLVCDGLAYALVHVFRTDVLKGTDLAQATVETLRWKLFKVGALVKETVRRIWFYFSSGWPFRSLFIQGYKNLCFDTS